MARKQRFIEILNWDKFQPRTDVTHSSWFRLEHSFALDPEYDHFDAEEKWLFIFLLSLASFKNRGKIRIDHETISARTKISLEKVSTAIQKLTDVNALRERNGNVTETARKRSSTRRDETGRNETKQDKTKQDEQRVPLAFGDAVPVQGNGKRPKAKSGKAGKEEPGFTVPTWEAYAEAYKSRYGADPLRNEKVNGELAKFVKRVGLDSAPLVAAFYLTHNKRVYVDSRHCIDLMLRDAESLHTDWQTGNRTTSTQALQVDKLQANQNVWGPMIEAARRAENGQA